MYFCIEIDIQMKTKVEIVEDFLWASITVRMPGFAWYT